MLMRRHSNQKLNRHLTNLVASRSITEKHIAVYSYLPNTFKQPLVNRYKHFIHHKHSQSLLLQDLKFLDTFKLVE